MTILYHFQVLCASRDLFLFLCEICFSAATGALLKGLGVDDFKPFGNSISNLCKREKLVLTQSRGYPSRRKANRLFYKSFILRLANAGRNNGCALVFRKFAVAFVQLRFIARVRCHAGLEVIRNKHSRHATKIFISMDIDTGLNFVQTASSPASYLCRLQRTDSCCKEVPLRRCKPCTPRR